MGVGRGVADEKMNLIGHKILSVMNLGEGGTVTHMRIPTREASQKRQLIKTRKLKICLGFLLFETIL
jgi:hypothetical protein